MAKFLKPSDRGWEEDKVDFEPTSGTRFVYNQHLSLAIDQQRRRLPIYKSREQILYLLEKYRTLVLVGETGCGKSTQLPQYLYESGWCDGGKMVAVVEPRRVAATSLATRVSQEMASLLGSTVGFSIRFSDYTSPETNIKYMTEGMLMREMMVDPLLRQYSVIMLDEVHERTLNTDILMGLLKKILRKRKGLRVVIASATVDAEKLQLFFNLNPTKKGRDEDKDTSVILSVEGRLHSVEIFFSQEPVPDYVKGVVDTVIKIHEKAADSRGDILAFLTGQEQVDTAVALLSQHDSISAPMKLYALPMYGSLTNNEQLKVFRPAPKAHRKVVIATNIAETSVTIPGIVYVVDCGYVKQRWFHAESFTDSLVVVPISKASARQRAGRAARVAPGQVYRLYTEGDYDKLKEDTVEEMMRCELSSAVLQLKALGIDNVVSFSFPSSPPVISLANGLELLHALGAVDNEGRLTEPLGLNMAEFPLSPQHAKALLSSYDHGCSEEMCAVLSLLQVENMFVGSGAQARIAKRNFEVSQGDLLTALNAYRAWSKLDDKSKAHSWSRSNYVSHKAMLRVRTLNDRMMSLLNKLNIPIVSAQGDGDKICKSLVCGFFANAAYLHYSGDYRTLRGDRVVYIHPTSVLYTVTQPQWLVYCETVQAGKLYMKDVTVIQPEWLHQLAPHFYHMTTDKD